MSTPKENQHLVITLLEHACFLTFGQDLGFLSFHRKHLWDESKEWKEISHTGVHGEVSGKTTNTLNLKKMTYVHMGNVLGRSSVELVDSQRGCVYTHM